MVGQQMSWKLKWKGQISGDSFITNNTEHTSIVSRKCRPALPCAGAWFLHGFNSWLKPPYRNPIAPAHHSNQMLSASIITLWTGGSAGHQPEGDHRGLSAKSPRQSLGSPPPHTPAHPHPHPIHPPTPTPTPYTRPPPPPPHTPAHPHPYQTALTGIAGSVVY